MSGNTSDIERCLERLRAGDPAAHDLLIDHAYNRLRRLTAAVLRSDFRRVRQLEQTDDVLQNVCARLLRTLKAVTPDSAKGFFTLATTEIRRELTDLARHYFGKRGIGKNEVARPVGGDDSSTPGDNDPEATSSYEPSHVAMWTELHEKVEAMPEDERAVFDLAWYQGLTHKEAARVLDVSLSTVKRRWVKARLALQEAFRGELPVP